MKCLCCGKEFDNSITLNKQSAQWHQSCVKKFFGTKTLPDIDISEQVLEQLAVESTAKGYTVPGVQKKLSLHLSEENRERPRLTLVNYPTGYILKPQTAEYRALPEAEYLVMSMAHITKIQTVPYALLRISADDHSMAYITKRIDRIRKSNQLHMLAMEDFCQLENRLTADKYKGSYERCAKVIARYSQTAGLDMAELFLRIVFSFAVGNSDMHLKNFSLIETSEGSGLYHLSSAYDMLPVNIIIPEDTEQLALTLNGKKHNIRRKDFLIFADSCGILRKSAEKMIKKIIVLKDTYIRMCQESYLPDDMKERFSQLICERISILNNE